MDSISADVRARYLALFRGGGLPDAAFELEPKHSIAEYENTAQEAAYREFAAEYVKAFVTGIEGMLIGRLFMANTALNELNPADNNYPKLMKQWLELLDRTDPVIAKMKDIQASIFPFDKLELKIEGVEGK